MTTRSHLWWPQEGHWKRNVELIWLTGRLMPDFKTIADFRKDNGGAIRTACREFVLLCRGLGLFEEATVAIDGSKFKAVNNRDRNFTERKLQARWNPHCASYQQESRNRLKFLGWLTGLEPTTTGITIRDSTN